MRPQGPSSSSREWLPRHHGDMKFSDHRQHFTCDSLLARFPPVPWPKPTQPGSVPVRIATHIFPLCRRCGREELDVQLGQSNRVQGAYEKMGKHRVTRGFEKCNSLQMGNTCFALKLRRGRLSVSPPECNPPVQPQLLLPA